MQRAGSSNIQPQSQQQPQPQLQLQLQEPHNFHTTAQLNWIPTRTIPFPWIDSADRQIPSVNTSNGYEITECHMESSSRIVHGPAALDSSYSIPTTSTSTSSSMHYKSIMPPSSDGSREDALIVMGHGTSQRPVLSANDNDQTLFREVALLKNENERLITDKERSDETRKFKNREASKRCRLRRIEERERLSRTIVLLEEQNSMLRLAAERSEIERRELIDKFAAERRNYQLR
jgi:hypothetical protein